ALPMCGYAAWARPAAAPRTRRPSIRAPEDRPALGRFAGPGVRGSADVRLRRVGAAGRRAPHPKTLDQGA
ncbi:hypothetical protein, partial [Streptomyces griseochromogenes]|uniref:hypothetical protein n=1 Tax=Streptomyces griseochromogenes TaxID=68214 RepID=UPI0037ABF4D4